MSRHRKLRQTPKDRLLHLLSFAKKHLAQAYIEVSAGNIRDTESEIQQAMKWLKATDIVNPRTKTGKLFAAIMYELNAGNAKRAKVRIKQLGDILKQVR